MEKDQMHRIFFVDGRSILVKREYALYNKLLAFNEGIFTEQPFIIVKDEYGKNVLINVATVTHVTTVTQQ